MLDAKTIAVIKKTAPLLAPRAEELTRHFYERMFAGNPEVRPLFSASHQRAGAQQRALAGAIVAYASNIDRLDALGPTVELLAQKHASLGILPAHYPIVGKHLLAAIQEMLGIDPHDEIIEAWGRAYEVLAKILIQREEAIYREHDASFGGRGFRRFVVARREPESEEIMSLYLRPADQRPTGIHKPGQYITIRTLAPDAGTTMRNYSLSNAPGTPFFRISVKRERAHQNGLPHGHVSSFLHDSAPVGSELEIAPPCGEFTLSLNPASGRPIVLLSGGVGITPLLSMLHATVDAGIDRDVYFIHAARNERVQAFREEVVELARRHPRTKAWFCCETLEGRISEPVCDSIGRIDHALLEKLLPAPDADFYFCGPRPFMQAQLAILKNWGVPSSQIRYEFFGPATDLEMPTALASA